VASFDEVVPPGQAGTIKASIHTQNYKGSIGKAITVTHDDKSQGPISVSVLAKIVGSVDVLPFPALQIGRRPRGFDTPARLIVRKDPTEEAVLAIDDLVSSVSWLKVTSRKVEADEPAVEGLPAAKPGDVVLSIQAIAAPIGTNVESVSFKTGLSREPKVTIPVTVNVQPLVTLQPNDLILNPNPDNPQIATGQVLAALRDDLDPKTVSVTSESKAFVVHVDPPEAKAFRVTVDWSGKGKHAATESTIKIHIGKETVNVPVRVNLARVASAK
jgi:hypothetical protein